MELYQKLVYIVMSWNFVGIVPEVVMWRDVGDIDGVVWRDVGARIQR